MAAHSQLRPYRQRAASRQQPAPVQSALSTTSTMLLFGMLLFVSGAAALVYQVVWIKQLGLIVGIDVYAVTAVLSAFFAGLGIGGLLGGRIADTAAQPLRLYALIELGIALLGAGATLAFSHQASFFIVLMQHATWLAWPLLFAMVGIPAALMGATLPTLLRSLSPVSSRISRASGSFYALNTFGAVAGTLLTAFLLIPALGVRGSALSAATANLVLALIAFLVSTTLSSKPLSVIDRSTTTGAGTSISAGTAVPSGRRAALVLYAIAGGIALGYEVIWSQILPLFGSTRVFAFTIMLAVYLSGLMLGSAIYARIGDRTRDPWGVFAILIASAALLAISQVALAGAWLPVVQTWAESKVIDAGGSQTTAMSARFAVASIALMSVPTLLLGAAFPIACRLVAEQQRIGRDIGATLAANTLGGIAGTLLTGFVLVPLIGLVHTLAVLATGASLVGLFAVFRGQNVRATSRFAVIAIAVSVLVLAALVPADRFAQMLAASRSGELVRYEESAGGAVAVLDQRASRSSFRRLYIQGVSNSGDAVSSLRYMRLQALLPLLIQRDEPRSAMVIALGTGITAGALTRYPGLEHRICVELLPAVVRAAGFFSGNYNVTTSGDVDIRINDGRRELLASNDRYDLITLEPPPPSAAGVVNLYSSDFYRIAKNRLTPSGLFAQWLPLSAQNNEDTQALVRSFLDIFPHAALWTTELHEMLLVGSLLPIELDAERISARFAQPQVAASLREIGIDSPQALLATWVMGREGLENYAGNVAPVTDDKPRIEYANWLRKGEFAYVLSQFLAQSHAPPLHADNQFRAQLMAARNELMTFYQAGLSAYRGEREQWGSALQRIAYAVDSNPYYRWIVRGE